MSGIPGKGFGQAGGERSIDLFKQLQIYETESIAFGKKSVSPRMGKFLDQTFCSQLGQVIAERTQLVFFGGRAQSFGHLGMDVASSKGTLSGDVAERAAWKPCDRKSWLFYRVDRWFGWHPVIARLSDPEQNAV